MENDVIISLHEAPVSIIQTKRFACYWISTLDRHFQFCFCFSLCFCFCLFQINLLPHYYTHLSTIIIIMIIGACLYIFYSYLLLFIWLWRFIDALNSIRFYIYNMWICFMHLNCIRAHCTMRTQNNIHLVEGGRQSDRERKKKKLNSNLNW